MSDLVNQIIFAPWPSYVGGPLIGVFVIAFLWIENKSLGVSSSFDEICSIGSQTKTSNSSWQITFVLGLVLGGALLYLSNDTKYVVALSHGATEKLNSYGITVFSGLVPSELFNFELSNLLFLFGGGFFIGFGARYAGGCTAGHSIMGIALLSIGSIVSTVSFFIGGLISSYFIVPNLF